MTHHRTRPLAAALLLTLSLVAGCGPAADEAAAASQASAADAPRQALEVADSVLAANLEEAGPVEGFWPFLARDAVFLEPGLDVVRGRDAIRSALSAVQPDPAPTYRLHRVSAGQSDDGGLGYTFGWTESIGDGGAIAYGKYVAMWRRAAGHWRVEAFVKSAGRGPPAPPAPGVLAGWHGVPSPGDPATLAEGVAAADAAFAAFAGVESWCAAFPAFADEHAIVFGGSNFYSGLDWVRLAYSGCTPADHAAWGPIHSASTASGDLGYTVGNATFWTDLETGPGGYTYSKYLTVWVRQADGGWKWLLDAGSARPGP